MSDSSRLLLEIENIIRVSNNEVLNPMIPELNTEKLKPVMEMVARARGEYLNALFKVTEENAETIPSADEIRVLASHRLKYEELVHGSQALCAAIERGYLDIAT